MDPIQTEERLTDLFFLLPRSTLNAERALASLEKSGEALTGIAGGNVRRSMFDVRVFLSDH